MTLDLGRINSITDAKNEKYGGVDLDDKNKALFDETKAELKGSDGNLSLKKVREIAELLDNVKWAERMMKKDTAILAALEAAKTKNDDIYQYVNKVDTQVVKAINRLKILEEDNTKYNGKTKSEWQAEKIKEQGALKVLQEDLDKKNGELNKIIVPASKILSELDKAKQEEKAVNIIVSNIKDKSKQAYKDIEKILKVIRTKNSKQNKVKLSGANNIAFDCGVEVEPGYKYLKKDTAINNIGNRFVQILAEINKKELFKTADAESTFFSDYSAEKDDVKLAFERLVKCAPDIDWRENASLKGGPYRLSFYKRMISKTTEKEFEDAYFLKDKDGTAIKDFAHFTRYARFGDLFLVLGDLFPKGSLSTNPLLDKNKGFLKDLIGNSLLDKEFEIRFTASKSPNVDGKNDDFQRDQKILVKKGKIGELLKFFWDIFDSADGKANYVLEKAYNDADDNQTKTMLAFEKKDEYIKEIDLFKAFQSHLFLEEVKRIFTDGSVKDSDGNDVKATWDESKRKVFLKFLQEASKMAEDDADIDNLKKLPYIKELLEKHSTPNMVVKLVSDPSAVQMISRSTFLKKSDNIYNYLDEMRVSASSEVYRKQSTYDFWMKSASGQLMGEIAGLEIKINDAKEKIQLIEGNIKNFENNDLKDLQKKFDAIYKQGTGNKMNPIYSLLELEQMNSLLYFISRRSESGILDATYLTKQKDLNDNVLKYTKPEEATLSRLLNSEELTFKKRVESLGIYGNLPEGIKAELSVFKTAFENLEKARKLTNKETKEKEEVIYYLTNEKYKDSAPPQVALTKEDLKEVLKGTDTTITDGTYWKDKWVATKSFKTKANIKPLIDSVWDATNNKPKDDFANFLRDTDNWGISKIAKDANQWQTFIKKEPKYIIGAIKLFTDYKQKAGDQAAIKAAMDKANGAKPKGTPWDSGKEQSIAEYLYMKADGQALDKEQIGNRDDGGDNTGDDTTAWWQKGFYWPIWSGAIVITAGILIYVYWESIANWWNGPAEEEGMGGKTDEEEES